MPPAPLEARGAATLAVHGLVRHHLTSFAARFWDLVNSFLMDQASFKFQLWLVGDATDLSFERIKLTANPQFVNARRQRKSTVRIGGVLHKFGGLI